MSITDERLEELASHFEDEAKRMLALGHHKDDLDILQQNEDNGAALRELQQRRAQPREIICKQCGLREQLGELPPAEF